MAVGFCDIVTVHHVPAYSEIYGQHPRTFVFAHDGAKLQVVSPPTPEKRTRYPVEHSLALCECEPPFVASTHRRSVNVSRIYQHEHELTGVTTGTRRGRACGRLPCVPPSEPTGLADGARPSQSVSDVHADQLYLFVSGSSDLIAPVLMPSYFARVVCDVASKRITILHRPARRPPPARGYELYTT